MTLVVAVKVLADAGEAALRHFGDLSREEAAQLLPMWAQMRKLRELDDATADEVTDLVLARFAPVEPPAVPGLDYLATDAAAIVAETVAEPDWWHYGRCACGAAPGEPCRQKGQERRLPHINRPLAEAVA